MFMTTQEPQGFIEYTQYGNTSMLDCVEFSSSDWGYENLEMKTFAYDGPSTSFCLF